MDNFLHEVIGLVQWFNVLTQSYAISQFVSWSRQTSCVCIAGDSSFSLFLTFEQFF